MSNSKINKKCIAKNKGQTVDGIAYEICGCMGLSRTKGHIRSETFWQDTIVFLLVASAIQRDFLIVLYGVQTAALILNTWTVLYLKIYKVKWLSERNNICFFHHETSSVKLN